MYFQLHTFLILKTTVVQSVTQIGYTFVLKKCNSLTIDLQTNKSHLKIKLTFKIIQKLSKEYIYGQPLWTTTKETGYLSVYYVQTNTNPNTKLLMPGSGEEL